MLRRIINIIVSFVFVFSTLGFTISRHYCGNNFVDFSINSQAETCCDMDGCCHTEDEHFQVNEDFVNSAFVDNFQEVKIDILFPLYFLSLDAKPIEKVNSTIKFVDLPPPHTIQTSLSLLQTYLC